MRQRADYRARFPLNIDRPDVGDRLSGKRRANSIHFDHAFAAETACNYLISRGAGSALIHPQGSGFADPGPAGL